MLDWFEPTGCPVHVLLTKSDKLSGARARQILVDVRNRLAERRRNYTAQLFSALRRTGVEEAEATFLGWLETEPAGAAFETWSDEGA